MFFIRSLIVLVTAVSSVESRSSFSAEDVFVRGTMSSDTQYHYMTASSSPIARGGSVEQQSRRRGGTVDATPVHVVEKARNAAVTFAVRVERHAFLQMPRNQSVQQNGKSRWSRNAQVFVVFVLWSWTRWSSLWAFLVAAASLSCGLRNVDH